MFRRFCGNGSGPLSAAETAAVQELAQSRGQLLMDDGITDVKSEAGYTACAVFLNSMDKASRALGLEVAPRGYRAKFSANYRALFPDNNRHYRVDVLEASVDQQFAIWVNGEKFELSADAIELAQRLQRSWIQVVDVLDRWQAVGANSAERRPGRSDFATELFAFDVAWSEFECRYISELIAIEEQARQLVVGAVKYESEVPQDSHLQPMRVACDEAERELVRRIATLNSVANFKRKGRDDLGCDILESARAVLRQQQQDGVKGREAARILAGDIVGSYTAMRTYFRKVGTCIEHVDPHLCNNAGLVSRLVDWEETWEVGARYVRSTPLLDAICDLVSEIRAAQQVAPELTTMVEDCDVELFLVLPRIVMLCFLADPLNKRTELVRSLLPHRFGPPGEGNSSAAFMKVDLELKALYDRYKETMTLLGGTRDKAAWEAVVRQAVLGTEEHQGRGGDCPSGATRAVADLLLSLEKWSLELQRHCPEDWNQCSAVLVHCLTGETQKKQPSKFQV